MPLPAVPTSIRNGGSNQVLPPGGNHRPKRTPLAAHSGFQPQPVSHSSPPSDDPYCRARAELLATLCRNRGKKLEPAMLTSSLKSSAKALGKSRNFQHAHQVLIDWGGEAVNHPPGRDATTNAAATAGSTARTPGRPSLSQAGTNLHMDSTH